MEEDLNNHAPDEMIVGYHWQCRCGRYRFRVTSAVPGLVLQLKCERCGHEAVWFGPPSQEEAA
jgi:hypothetical protein